MNTLKEKRSCPCYWTNPCSLDCTCIKPYSSYGCNRCCTYGSEMQHKKQAKILAESPAELLNAVRHLHNFIDNLNAEIGTSECLCLLCKSKEYNSEIGIKHLSMCPIIKARIVMTKYCTLG